MRTATAVLLLALTAPTQQERPQEQPQQEQLPRDQPPDVARDADPQQKLHPYLRAQLAQAAVDRQLPVYFVLADRLGHEHFLPRVARLPLAERRATVLRELRAHAAASQALLLDYLAAERRAGNVSAIRGNWLGNFVQARATPLAVLTAASLPGVEAVWSDEPPPRAAVEDADAAPMPPARATAAPMPLAATGAGAAAALPSAGTTAAARLPAGATVAPLPAPGAGAASVGADRVWNLGFRGQGVVVASVDGGMTAHQDLDNRRWTNAAEIPNNQIDDDRNGFVDDVHGWAFDTNTADFDDFGGHGTNAAGAICADGSCSGTVEGMAPQAQLITCRILSETDQWNAIQYALAMGADVQTSSYSYKAWFQPPPNYRMHRDVGTATLAAGLIRTNSTSNDGLACGGAGQAQRRPFNVSAPGCLPTPYLDPNQLLQGNPGGVLGIAAWNFTADALSPTSPCGPFAWSLADLQANVPAYPVGNWNPQHDDYPWSGGSQQGLLKPDLAAPTGTRTPGPGPCGYITFSGTSNATPCAAGVLALWKGANPSLGPEDIAMIAHQTARDRGSVAGKENGWGAGVIDAEAGLYRALCVHRLDGEPQWRVAHAQSGGPLQVGVDGVPGSLTVVLVGLARQPLPVGPIEIGVGPLFATLLVGATDAAGDFAALLPLPAPAIGLPLFTQAFVWDQTFTQRVLASNVIGLDVLP